MLVSLYLFYMQCELQRIIDESLEQTFSNGLPIGGELKYNKQEPGGVFSASNVDELIQELQNIDEESFRIYNEKLCPALWNDQLQLHPEIRSNLLKLAYDFYKKTELKAPIIDVYLMGSIANYNWTVNSDADIHIIIDYNQLQMPLDTVPEILRSLSSKWNMEHEVTVKGYKVELNFQSSNEAKQHVTGIYSLKSGTWIRTPVHQNVNVNKMLVQEKFKAMKKYIEFVIGTDDIDQMKQAKKYIDSFRQYGLDTAGELSVENIVFKALRAKGILKELKNAIIDTYDKNMSVYEGSGVGGNTVKKDIKYVHPPENVIVSPSDIPFDKLSLDNLNSLKNKVYKSYKYYQDKQHNNNTITKLEKDIMLDIINYYNKIDAEINRRLSYINNKVAIGNPNVDEGYGCGNPELDRLKLKNCNGSTKRWQIKSKDAPKTPKIKNMKEDIEPTDYRKSQMQNSPINSLFKIFTDIMKSKSDRIDLFPEDSDNADFANILKAADAILLKKSKDGIKKFSMEYVNAILDKLMQKVMPDIDKDSMPYNFIKQGFIVSLLTQYDIE